MPAKGTKYNPETGKYERAVAGEIPQLNPTDLSSHETEDTPKNNEHVEKPQRKRRRGTIDFSGVESLLLGIHLGLAHLLEIRELELEKEEAKALADALSAVARHYDLPDLPQKTVDWINLFIVMGSIYAPRIIAYKSKSHARVTTKEAVAPPASEASASFKPLPLSGEEIDFPVSTAGPESFC